MRERRSSSFPSASFYEYDSTDIMYLSTRLCQNARLGGTDK